MGAGPQAGATPASSAAGPRAGAAPAPSLEPLLQPRAWQGVVYRPLTEGGAGDTARALFTYAAVWVPPASPGELGWAAWDSEEGQEAEGHGRGEAREPVFAHEAGEPTGRVPAERLVGALLLEPHETVGAGPGAGATPASVGMVYGPVVVNHPDPFEVASHLLAATLPHATALGIGTLFARPQGLERLWVRFGFIPVPERELPKAFKARPGSGLFAWRGGSALWSTRKTGSSDEVR